MVKKLGYEEIGDLTQRENPDSGGSAGKRESNKEKRGEAHKGRELKKEENEKVLGEGGGVV